MDPIKGYKVFNPDWTCSPRGNTKQYTCPGKFEEDISTVRCGKGMHFCRKAADCFNYYSFNPENKVAEVIAYGDIAEEGDKCCTNKLEIVREIPWQELLEIVNTGKGCTGLGTPATGTPATVTPATGTPATGTPATVTPATGTPATVTPATVTPATGTKVIVVRVILILSTTKPAASAPKNTTLDCLTKKAI